MNQSSKSFPFLQTLLKEDWLAVAVSFLLIVLAAVGLLGPTGLNITY